MYCKKNLHLGLLVLCLLWQGGFLIGQNTTENYVQKVTMAATFLSLEFADGYQNFTAEISGPDNFYLRKDLKNTPIWTIQSEGFPQKAFVDGLYKIQITPNLAQSEKEQEELRFLAKKNQVALLKAKRQGLNIPEKLEIYNRSFSIQEGAFVLPRREIKELKAQKDSKYLSELKLAANTAQPMFASLNQAIPTAEDLGLNPRPIFVTQVFAEDLIVQGSACVGFDCEPSESFGFDTQRFKENNLRIHFDDSSGGGTFPSNDWRIQINETTNGGADFFAISDATSGRQVFRVDAGAPSNSLYIDERGHVGVGTNIPSVEVHAKDGDSPALRLEQDGSNGFGAQTWDIAGNETNFFVRDVTNGSKLPFKIKPDAPTNSVFIATTGVGIGEANPEQKLHVSGNVAISGSILPVSDQRLKKNIHTINNALQTIQRLRPTSYQFRTTEFAEMNLLAGIQYGFIAQELEQVLPTLVTKSSNSDPNKNFRRVNYTGVIPFLVKGIQEQQDIINNQQAEIDALKAQLDKMNALAAKVDALVKLVEGEKEEVINEETAEE